MTMIEITKDFAKWARYKHGDVWKRMTLEKLLARCAEGVKYNHRESEALIAYLQAEVTEILGYAYIHAKKEDAEARHPY